LEAVLELAKEASTGIARARRFSLQLPVRYRTLGAETWYQGKTENVSCTGMLIRAGERMDVDQPVEVVLVLEVDVVGEVSPEVLCLGHVVRKHDPVPTSPFARVAVRIQDYHFPGEVPFAKA
jgi:hypothetical protein